MLSGSKKLAMKKKKRQKKLPNYLLYSVPVLRHAMGSKKGARNLS
jgi:hypothetical protein